MRTIVIAFFVALALFAVAAPAQADPVVQSVYFVQDPDTRDSGVDLCGTGRQGRYGWPMYKADLYQDLQGNGGYQIFRCSRGGPNGQTDEYLSTDPNCTVAENTCYYDNYGYAYYCYSNYYYGNRDWSFPALYTAAYPIDPSGHDIALYLCMVTVQNQYGGWWTEFSVMPNYCSAGTQMTFLGYAHAQPSYSGEAVALQSAYQQCVAGSGCWGECGANCDGLLGTHIATGACLAHDECVCRNGGNIWAWECMGDFILAGLSWVAQVAINFLNAIVNAVVNVFKAIVRFLCFWC